MNPHDADFAGQAVPSAQAGHESIAMPVRGILVFGAALVVLSVLVLAIIAVTMTRFRAREQADGLTTRQLITKKEGDFPEPVLQYDDAFDMEQFRRQEEAALSSYGWADRKAGIARIPIDRAIELVAKNGLPKARSVEPKPTAAEPSKAAEPAKKE
jgi:hypothetical protein